MTCYSCRGWLIRTNRFMDGCFKTRHLLKANQTSLYTPPSNEVRTAHSWHWYAGLSGRVQTWCCMMSLKIHPNKPTEKSQEGGYRPKVRLCKLRVLEGKEEEDENCHHVQERSVYTAHNLKSYSWVHRQAVMERWKVLTTVLVLKSALSDHWISHRCSMCN